MIRVGLSSILLSVGVALLPACGGSDGNFRIGEPSSVGNPTPSPTPNPPASPSAPTPTPSPTPAPAPAVGVDRTNSVWQGSVDVVGRPRTIITVVTNDTVWRYLISETRESGTIFFDDENASTVGRAFLHPGKGRMLQDGSEIDAGDAMARYDSPTNLSASVSYESTPAQAFTAQLNMTVSELDSSLMNIAGRYTGIAEDGLEYFFEIDESGRFLGIDEDGCFYDLTTTFREGQNLYSSSGRFDPACDSNGANFIDAAYWEPGFGSATWFVRFRGDQFVLTMRR